MYQHSRFCALSLKNQRIILQFRIVLAGSRARNETVNGRSWNATSSSTKGTGYHGNTYANLHDWYSHLLSVYSNEGKNILRFHLFIEVI